MSIEKSVLMLLVNAQNLICLSKINITVYEFIKKILNKKSYIPQIALYLTSF